MNGWIGEMEGAVYPTQGRIQLILHSSPENFAEHAFTSHRRKFCRKFVASSWKQRPDDDALEEQKQRILLFRRAAGLRSLAARQSG
jgi:hypothetical protein